MNVDAWVCGCSKFPPSSLTFKLFTCYSHFVSHSLLLKKAGQIRQPKTISAPQKNLTDLTIIGFTIFL